jgi:hypothetical protein
LHPKEHEFVKTLPASAQEVLFGGAGRFEGRFSGDWKRGLRIMIKKAQFSTLEPEKALA